MTEDRQDHIDFSVLDPTLDPVRFDRSVAGVMYAARFELARRHKQENVLAQLSRWQGPVAAAAVLAVLLTYSVLSGSETAPAVIADDYMGLPEQVAQWVGAETLPAAEEILFMAENRGP